MYRSRPKLRLSAVCALAAALTAVPTAAARPASAQTKPKVLAVVATGFGLQLTPTQVGAALYTVQVHNIGEYTVRVTIGRLLAVTVPPNGWRFRDVRFKSGVTYRVHAVGPLRGLVWDTSLTSQ